VGEGRDEETPGFESPQNNGLHLGLGSDLIPHSSTTQCSPVKAWWWFVGESVVGLVQRKASCCGRVCFSLDNKSSSFQ